MFCLYNPLELEAQSEANIWFNFSKCLFHTHTHCYEIDSLFLIPLV